MSTSKNPLRTRASLVIVAGLASLLGGCVIEAKIGDDPVSEDGGTMGETESSLESTTTSGYTSAAEAGQDSACTGANPGSASATSTTGAGEDDDDDDDSASATSVGPGPGVDPETALELCEVPVVPPGPDDPVILESVLCDGGCLVEIETAVEVDLLGEYGECLCEAMDCGPAVGGTSTTEGPVDTDSGEPDGCGDFPDGDQGFICTCESCSVVVNDVDATWLANEADLQTICECMCGGAGCGLPE